MNTRIPQHIALVAHDGAKTAMLELVERHQSVLRTSRLVATATLTIECGWICSTSTTA